MKRRALVSETLLASTQGSEILRRLWDNVAFELHHNPPGRNAVTLDVEENTAPCVFRGSERR